MQMEDLIGRIILDAFWDRFSGSIFLATHAGAVKLHPEGECCAMCFIQHVSNCDALKGAVLLRVERMQHTKCSNADEDGYTPDVVEQWGYVLHTDKGTSMIEMRLEHNGYYGGSLEIDHSADVRGEYLKDF